MGNKSSKTLDQLNEIQTKAPEHIKDDELSLLIDLGCSDDVGEVSERSLQILARLISQSEDFGIRFGEWKDAAGPKRLAKAIRANYCSNTDTIADEKWSITCLMVQILRNLTGYSQVLDFVSVFDDSGVCGVLVEALQINKLKEQATWAVCQLISLTSAPSVGWLAFSPVIIKTVFECIAESAANFPLAHLAAAALQKLFAKEQEAAPIISANINGFGILVHALGSEFINRSFKVAVLASLSHWQSSFLPTNPDYINLLCISSTIALEADSGDAELRYWALKPLVYLVKSEQQQHEIRRLVQAHPSLVKALFQTSALSQHPDCNHSQQLNVLVAEGILHLLMQYPPAELSQQQVLEAITNSLVAVKSECNLEYMKWSIQALGAVSQCSSSIAASISEMPAAVDLLTTALMPNAFREQAASTLCAITQASPTSCIHIGRKIGILTALMEAVSAKRQVKLREYALKALGNLAFDSVEAATGIIGIPRAVSTLIYTLKDTENEAIQKLGARAIANLACKSKNARKVIGETTDGISLLIELQHKAAMSKNEELQDQCIRALGNLACDCAANCSVICEQPLAVECLLTAASSQIPTACHIRQRAISVIGHLLAFPSSKRCIGVRVTSILVSALHPTENMDLRSRAARALNNFTSGSKRNLLAVFNTPNALDILVATETDETSPKSLKESIHAVLDQLEHSDVPQISTAAAAARKRVDVTRREAKKARFMDAAKEQTSPPRKAATNSVSFSSPSSSFSPLSTSATMMTPQQQRQKRKQYENADTDDDDESSSPDMVGPTQRVVATQQQQRISMEHAEQAPTRLQVHILVRTVPSNNSGSSSNSSGNIADYSANFVEEMTQIDNDGNDYVAATQFQPTQLPTTDNDDNTQPVLGLSIASTVSALTPSRIINVPVFEPAQVSIEQEIFTSFPSHHSAMRAFRGTTTQNVGSLSANRQIAIKFVHVSTRRDNLSGVLYKIQKHVAELMALDSNDTNPIEKYFGVYVDTNYRVGIVTEWTDGPTLAQIAGLVVNGSESVPIEGNIDFLESLVNVASSLALMHSQNLIHRNVNPGNVIIRSDNRVSLINSSVPRLLEELQLSPIEPECLAFMAPETYQGDFSTKSDVYAFGMTMWSLSTRTWPWKGVPMHVLYHKVCVQHQRPNIPTSSPCSRLSTESPGQSSSQASSLFSSSSFPSSSLVSNRPFCQLIQQCWQPNPADRPCMLEVVEQLQNIQTVINN